MSTPRTDPTWKAALAAALLFLLGAVAGVAGDRVWLRGVPAAEAAEPLTVAGLSSALNLDPAQGARVRSVLDSLQTVVSQAALAGADSLRSVSVEGRRRLEEALPPDRRVAFQQWMEQRHAQMMREMGGGMMGRGRMRGPRAGRGGMRGAGDTVRPPFGGRGGGMGPRMMHGPDSGRGRVMGPGMMRSDTGG
jgi:hypothetical protein